MGASCRRPMGEGAVDAGRGEGIVAGGAACRSRPGLSPIAVPVDHDRRLAAGDQEPDRPLVVVFAQVAALA
jgi:hypothetical protein